MSTKLYSSLTYDSAAGRARTPLNRSAADRLALLPLVTDPIESSELQWWRVEAHRQGMVSIAGNTRL